MQEFTLIDRLPHQSLEGGIELLESLWLYISYRQVGNHWIVSGGDRVLLRTDSRDAAEAFIYGQALAYSSMGPELQEQLRQRWHP